MDQISKKIKNWIDNGKDPRSAHWQGGLESILGIFAPDMTPGTLSVVSPLNDKDLPYFEAALEQVDLSPNLLAAFLPPSVADAVIPPESAEELLRIDKGKPSYKILICRPGKEMRILCAEISKMAKSPGADIFQDGALLGSYNFDTHDACLEHMPKTLRAHLWKKEKWSMEEHKRYTMNWFEKVTDLEKGTVPVVESFSYLHSPTLIKAGKVDAIFTLLFDTLIQRFENPEDHLSQMISRGRAISDEKLRNAEFNHLAEKGILEILKIIRDYAIIKFNEFSNTENESFKREFSRTLSRLIEKMK